MSKQIATTPPSSGDKTPSAGWQTLYLGLGSNLGRRRTNLRRALERLDHMEGCRLLEQSGVYETEPEGAGSNWYLNLVVHMETILTPHDLLARVLDLEVSLGRDRTRPWPDRTLDIDILLWEHTRLDTEDLTLPHPRMHRRLFVLVPLAELDPTLRHPILDETIGHLVRRAPAARLRLMGTL